MRWDFFVAAMAAAMVVTYAHSAHACGGFFCSAGTPVEQTGEDVIFAVEDDGSIEAHVQIRYEGPAEDFAWILPVPTVPEVDVGVAELFTALRNATVPQLVVRPGVEGECASCSAPTAPITISDAGVRPDAPGGPPPPRIVSESGVGPYDVAVLDASDAEGLFRWLIDHGYDVSAEAVPLLMDYVRGGSYFVALRLASGRSVGEIQPIVLRYREQSPCLPIKLTAIATVADLPIRVFILGAERARATNYAETRPDLGDAALFMGDVGGYTNAVSRAVDEAGGRAFIVEYAAETPRIRLPVPDVRVATETNPTRLISHMTTLARLHPAVRELIAEHLGKKLEDLDASDFRLVDPNLRSRHLDCAGIRELGCRTREVHRLSRNLVELSHALHALLVEPRLEANALIQRMPQTTRFFTTMSADEMLVDPLFELRAAVPRVSPFITAELVTLCSDRYTPDDAPQVLIPPGGEPVLLRDGVASTCVEPPLAASVPIGCTASGGSPPAPPALALLSLVLLATRRRRG